MADVEKFMGVSAGDIEKIMGVEAGDIEKVMGVELPAGAVYKVHTFTANGTFEVTTAGGNVNFLLIAGAGAGREAGSNEGGGGGAGGMLETTGQSVSTQEYAIVIGAGGSWDGNDSTGFGATAVGGGHGASGTASTGDGGSGGGAGSGGSGAGTGGSGTAGQGNDGGDGATYPSNRAGGGGGKGSAGQDGQSDNNLTGRGGAPGASSLRTGSAVYYAGGGGGCSATGAGGYADAQNRGTLGGGWYYDENGDFESSGTYGVITGGANTGSGGRGASNQHQAENTGRGDGGSGLCVIRYRSDEVVATGGTITEYAIG